MRVGGVKVTAPATSNAGRIPHSTCPDATHSLPFDHNAGSSVMLVDASLNLNFNQMTNSRSVSRQVNYCNVE